MEGLNFTVNVEVNVDDAELDEALEKVERAKRAAKEFSETTKELAKQRGVESTIEIPEDIFLGLLGSYLGK